MEFEQILIVVSFGLLMLGVIAVLTKATSGLNRSYYKSKWSGVQKTLKDGKSGQKLAIIDADKLLDHAMKAARIRGSTMGERLKNADKSLGSIYQSVWEAHKLRNRLVHEDVNLKKKDVDQAMRTYHKALKNLGAI